jgi:hypothetical protein
LNPAGKWVQLHYYPGSFLTQKITKYEYLLLLPVFSS